MKINTRIIKKIVIALILFAMALGAIFPPQLIDTAHVFHDARKEVDEERKKQEITGSDVLERE